MLDVIKNSRKVQMPKVSELFEWFKIEDTRQLSPFSKLQFKVVEFEALGRGAR